MEKLTVALVAKELEMTEQQLRCGLRYGKYEDIGRAIPSKTGRRYSYVFFRHKLEELLGKKIGEEEK